MASTQPSPRTVATPVVGTTSVLAVPANVTRAGLVVFNPNTAASLAISPPDTTPSINGAGTILLTAGMGVELDGWTNGINAIASQAGQQITIYEFYT